MDETRRTIDIESCAFCVHLIFPGEDVIVVGNEYAHIAHQTSGSPLLASVA